MINDQLLGYVKSQLSLNMNKETIVANLKLGGWTDADINEAFSAVQPNVVPTVTPASPFVSGATPNISGIQTNLSPATTHSKNRKIIPAIIIIIILIIAGGAAGYAYYTGMFVSLQSLVTESVSGAKNITSSKYDVAFNLDFSGIKNTGLDSSLSSLGIDSKKISFTVKGSYDISNLDNLKNSSVLSLDIGSISLGGEFRMVNNILYAELTKVPNLSMLPSSMISPYQNKWFSLPFKTINDEIATNSLGSSFSGVSIKNNLTLEQKDHLYQMTKDAHLVKQIARLSPETIEGEYSYHYSFDLDREGLVSYLQSLTEYMKTIFADNANLAGLPAFDPDSVTKGLDQVKDFKGEIWVGRSDKLLRKIAIDFGVTPDSAKDEQVKINLVYIFSGYNQPVTVVVPAESTSVEALIEASRQKGKEASIKANLSNIRTEAEIFYDKGSAYSGFCSSNNLISARQSIEASGGVGFVCKATASKYAIGVKLSEASGNWCVDSTGASKATATLPTGTVCPAQ
ncbi:MAG: hypothetical protein NTZ87_00325 [Candidatus Nomurabacteria bacterium]|nr:hypothetical protein [Candidatus Nomurabacteria bacterium]